MKKNGYPLLIATMLVIVVFEAMEIAEDLKEKKNTILGGTLSEAIVFEGTDDDKRKDENLTLADLQEAEAEKSEAAPECVHGKKDKEDEMQEEEVSSKELVPVMEMVDESYFDDAVFIGDSRMYGLMQYSGLENATFYTSIGLNIYDLFEKKYIVPETGGSKTDLETALRTKNFKKIYLMVGLNELGRNTDEGFADTYRQAVEQLQELQPEAIIYVNAILKVTDKKSRKDKIIKNEKVESRNALLASIPDGERVFWNDINEVFCNENGVLDPEFTGDEVHLYAKYYKMWVVYMMEHAYVFVEKENQ